MTLDQNSVSLFPIIRKIWILELNEFDSKGDKE